MKSGLIRAMNGVKRLVDWLASRFDPEFPHTIQADEFCEGKTRITAAAKRDAEGSYDVFTRTGCSSFHANANPGCAVPLMYGRDRIRAVSLSDAVRILDSWTRAQEQKPALVKEPAPTFGGGAHYRNVAGIKKILL
jgi:hypothetical protein